MRTSNRRQPMTFVAMLAVSCLAIWPLPGCQKNQPPPQAPLGASNSAALTALHTASDAEDLRALSNQQSALVSDPSFDPILGKVPPVAPPKGPLPDPVVSFQVGSDVHEPAELVEVAIQYLARTGETIQSNRVRFYLTIRTDDKAVVAEVVVGEGIGRPTWRLTIGRSMQVLSCRKGIGHD